MTAVRAKRRRSRVRRGTKILDKEDCGRHVFKLIVRLPHGMDDPDAKLASRIIAGHATNVMPPGSEVELTLRRHGDKTGNLLEGEAAAKRYSNANKTKAEDEARDKNGGDALDAVAHDSGGGQR